MSAICDHISLHRSVFSCAGATVDALVDVLVYV
jgi:hypothetical protein